MTAATFEFLEEQFEPHALREHRVAGERVRFLDVDTFEGSPSEPHFLRKYAYANGDPVQNTDPTGHFALAGMLTNFAMGAALNSFLLPRAAKGYRGAQGFQQDSGLAFGQPFIAVQSDVFGDTFGRHLANDEPGFWESAIPVWDRSEMPTTTSPRATRGGARSTQRCLLSILDWHQAWLDPSSRSGAELADS